MDPKACLDEIRAIIAGYDQWTDEDKLYESDRVINLIVGLDSWMTKGGFSPWEN